MGKGGKPRRVCERKRKKQNESSFEGTDSEGKADDAKKLKEASLNVVIWFEGVDEVKKVDPLKLTKIIRMQFVGWV